MLQAIRNLTPTQWIILGISTAGFLNASTAQLTEWFGPKVAHDIISGLGFAQGLIGCWVMALSGQGSIVKQVLAMPGVQHIEVNADASATLAQIAVDKNVDKIAPAPAVQAKVEQIARVGVLLAAFLLPILLFSPAMAQGALRARPAGPIEQAIDKAKADIAQKNAQVAAANPAGPNDPSVSCDFNIFVGLNPKNLESAIKKCVSDGVGTLVDDTARALDSAQNFKPNPDQDAINCLAPGLAILKAGVILPAVAEVKDANGNITTAGVTAKSPGLILLFQKYREFVLAGGLTSCKTWVDTAANATATQAVNNVAGLAGAALLLPK